MPRGGTIYDRMEREARSEGRRPRLLRQILIEGALLTISVFLLAYLLYAAQFSGRVRWLLGFVLIGILAGYAWRLVARRTSEPAPLAAPPAATRLRTGELAGFTAVVRRASQGLPYSQYAVSNRARDILAERTRLARGLSPESMRSLEQDPAGLRSVLRDGVLEAFLYLPSSDTEARYRWVWEARARGGYDAALAQVLEHMEAWR